MTSHAAPQTIERPDTGLKPQISDGDHDRFSHYVRKSGLTESYIEGNEVTALCGKRWVPTRDPDRFPICPTCKDLYGLIMSGAGAGDEE